MLPRDLVTLAVMTSLAVAVVDGAPAADPEDYEVFADDEARSADNGNVFLSFARSVTRNR